MRARNVTIISIMQLKVVLERGEDGFVVAHIPALPGCWSQGGTRDEAITHVKEAAELWLEVQRDRVESPPTAEIAYITL
jgi:predicted RNase H-like HicB family nuclease